MSVRHESQLRDLLAADLAMVESGLRLVAKEFQLSNSVGTRGFIDILARDSHGSWVVIEVKRTKKTTREAVQEVAKYAELLCREKRLPRDRVRIIIVAVQWDELLVPVSSVARDWSHDMTCYRVVLDGDGCPAGTEEVSLLPLPIEGGLTPIHGLFFFNTPVERDQGWSLAARRAGDFGTVGVDLRYTGPEGIVIAPLALYIAIGRVLPEQAHPDLMTEAEAQDPGGPVEEEYSLERAALRQICRDVSAVTWESANPDTYRHLLDHEHWQVEDVRRAGALKHDDLREDEDLRRAMAGNDGHSQVHFTGSARPKDRNRWVAFQTQMRTSLAGNDQWSQLIRLWLDDIADQRPDDDVMLHIFNPCDLMQAVVFGWPDRLADYAPMVLGFSVSKTSDTFRRVEGTVYWDGHYVPDLAQRVRLVYRDPLQWRTTHYGGVTWQSDQMLLDLLGLSYVLVDTVTTSLADKDHDQEAKFLAVCGNGPQWVTDPKRVMAEEQWNGLYSLHTFLDRHATQIDALAAEYRARFGS